MKNQIVLASVLGLIAFVGNGCTTTKYVYEPRPRPMYQPVPQPAYQPQYQVVQSAQPVPVAQPNAVVNTSSAVRGFDPNLPMEADGPGPCDGCGNTQPVQSQVQTQIIEKVVYVQPPQQPTYATASYAPPSYGYGYPDNSGYQCADYAGRSTGGGFGFSLSLNNNSGGQCYNRGYQNYGYSTPNCQPGYQRQCGYQNSCGPSYYGSCSPPQNCYNPGCNNYGGGQRCNSTPLCGFSGSQAIAQSGFHQTYQHVNNGYHSFRH